jgi:DinB superfamily
MPSNYSAGILSTNRAPVPASDLGSTCIPRASVVGYRSHFHPKIYLWKREPRTASTVEEKSRKRLLSIAVIVMYVAIAAQTQSSADKERALKYLERTKQAVLDATAGLSEEQWNFKSGPDRWSVAEVTEHIAAAEDLLRGMIVEKVMTSPVQPEGSDVKANDDAVLAMIPDRTHKAQAPEPLKPTNRFGSPQESLKHFIESRQKTSIS